MSLIKWNQPGKLTGRRNWIENFFSEADDFLKNWEWDTDVNVPAVNVREENNMYMIDMAAPGMKKEDFSIEIENGVLIISATSREEKEEKTDSYRRQEFSYRDFKRSFWLPENVNADAINATYEDGLLKLTLPKQETKPAENGKKIKVV